MRMKAQGDWRTDRVPAHGRRESGMTLVELLVALAIGLFLMVGAFTVYLQTRSTFQLSQTMSRLEENGRFALDTIEPDIRMAQFWGRTSRTNKIQGRAAPADPTSALDPGDCGNNWTVNLSEQVGGTNDVYSWTCAGPYGAAAMADTLVIRRANATVSSTPLDATKLYVQSARFQDGLLFTGSTTIPTGYSATTSETHELVVDGYYVSSSSAVGANVPSLRVMSLTAGPAVQDQEIMPGVEDMQVQFGVDVDANCTANRGAIDRYVDPGDPMLDPTSASYNPNARIIAVRVWLRIRAETPEVGFTDDKTYTYADQSFTPGDNYRRILVSKTIYIRNARQPPC